MWNRNIGEYQQKEWENYSVRGRWGKQHEHAMVPFQNLLGARIPSPRLCACWAAIVPRYREYEGIEIHYDIIVPSYSCHFFTACIKNITIPWTTGWEEIHYIVVFWRNLSSGLTALGLWASRPLCLSSASLPSCRLLVSGVHTSVDQCATLRVFFTKPWHVFQKTNKE